MTEEQKMTITARQISGSLIQWQRFSSRGAMLANVYVNGGPWESDVVKIMKSLLFVEYEIKLTKRDFDADFDKCHHKFDRATDGSRVRVPVTKHDFYVSGDKCIGTVAVPRPKQFYFVCPKNMVSVDAIPEHAGLIYFDHRQSYAFGMQIEKRAPSLKNPTRLSDHNLFSLLYKATWKMVVGYDSRQPGTVPKDPQGASWYIDPDSECAQGGADIKEPDSECD